MAFEASCHCQKVKVSINAALPTEGLECNCSMCKRRGTLLQFFPASLASFTGDGDTTTYTFNKHKIMHKFCKTCGVAAFSQSEHNGQQMVAVNLRCVPDIDLDTLKIDKVDGAKF